MIVCIAIPYFAAQIERRDDRRLARRPLAIGGQPWEADPIFAFSQEVARRGVRPGTPLRQAHLLAPHAHFMPAYPPHYQAVSAELRERVAEVAAIVEPAEWWQTPITAAEAIGRQLPAHYFTSLDDLPAKEVLPLTRHLGRTLREQTHLRPAVGVAAHKFTAQVAATIARPDHLRPVAPEAEVDFLAAYPLSFLPLDRETGRRCRLLGLRTLGDLARLPAPAVQAQFGREMACWQQWAQGQDETPLQPRPAERAEMVSYGFDDPLTTLEPITRLLEQAAQALAARLQPAGWQAQQVTLMWETETGRLEQTHTWRQPVATAGQLTTTLAQLLDQARFPAGVLGVTVTLSGLTPLVLQQLSLFASPAGMPPVDELVHRIAARHPRSRFYRATLAPAGHPLPERRFQLQAAHDALVA